MAPWVPSWTPLGSFCPSLVLPLALFPPLQNLPNTFRIYPTPSGFIHPFIIYPAPCPFWCQQNIFSSGKKPSAGRRSVAQCLFSQKMKNCMESAPTRLAWPGLARAQLEFPDLASLGARARLGLGTAWARAQLDRHGLGPASSWDRIKYTWKIHKTAQI